MKIKIDAMNSYLGPLSLIKEKGLIFEPKLDGIRAICYVNQEIQFLSRNDNNLTVDFPELNIRKNIKAKKCILDGEIIAFDEHGNPNFNLLQLGHEGHYIVFDILMKNGKKLINLPLSERKKILKETVRDGANIAKIPYTTNGQKLWDAIKKRNLEGIMAKYTDSIYYPGSRTKVWQKIKLLNTIDCVIVGYQTGKRIISSLMLGLYDSKGELNYLCKVGTGFNFEILDQLYDVLKSIETNKYYMKNDIRLNDVHWVKPKIVCEIKFLEMTKDKRLRAPVFLRIRIDKEAKDCTFELQQKLS